MSDASVNVNTPLPTLSSEKPSACSESAHDTTSAGYAPSHSGGDRTGHIFSRTIAYERLEDGTDPKQAGLVHKWLTGKWKRLLHVVGVVVVLFLFGIWPAGRLLLNPVGQNGLEYGLDVPSVASAISPAIIECPPGFIIPDARVTPQRQPPLETDPGAHAERCTNPATQSPESGPYVPLVINESSPSSPKPETHTTTPQKPTSFETDPDASKTVFCTKPADPSKPLVQYALVIDAGSAGSRIHTYKFNNCGSSPSLEYETFKMRRSSLYYFQDNPEDAAKSLDVLMDEAIRVVPETLRGCTPVAVKISPALQLLSTPKSEAIIQAIEKRLKEVHPFHLYGDVEIMQNKDASVYTWIAANYLLGNFKTGSTTTVLDLGGALAQIVFQTTSTDSETEVIEREHKHDFDFAGQKYGLYQRTYLGYGLMRARMGVHELVSSMSSLQATSSEGGMVDNPCLARGTKRTVTVIDNTTRTRTEVEMAGKDVGSFEACNKVVELIIARDTICQVKPCSLGTFSDGEALLLSYFYDRIAPLVSVDAPLTVSSIADLAEKVCLGKPSWMQYWGGNKKLIDELDWNPEWCFDLTFMHGLLKLKYKFEDERKVKVIRQIEGTNLGWTLGAALVMLGEEPSCRV